MQTTYASATVIVHKETLYTLQLTSSMAFSHPIQPHTAAIHCQPYPPLRLLPPHTKHYHILPTSKNHAVRHFPHCVISFLNFRMFVPFERKNTFRGFDCVGVTHRICINRGYREDRQNSNLRNYMDTNYFRNQRKALNCMVHELGSKLEIP